MLHFFLSKQQLSLLWQSCFYSLQTRRRRTFEKNKKSHSLFRKSPGEKLHPLLKMSESSLRGETGNFPRVSWQNVLRTESGETCWRGEMKTDCCCWLRKREVKWHMEGGGGGGRKRGRETQRLNDMDQTITPIHRKTPYNKYSVTKQTEGMGQRLHSLKSINE